MDFRLLEYGQEAEASHLVGRVFHRSVAPLFPSEGVKEFLSYATAEAMAERREQGNLQLAAWAGAKMAAYLEMRAGPHLAMLFIDSPWQRQGVGRRLLAHALELLRRREPGFSRVTVNSSPNSVEAYRRMGFRASGESQTKNGISFVPMYLEIAQSKVHT